MDNWLPWTVFGVVVLGGLVLDLGVFNRGEKAVSVRGALLFTVMWIAVGLAFDGLVWAFVDPRHADHATRPSIEFLTCYLTEYALSVDNIFVFIVIFRYFAIPAENQHRVLLWGVLGAMLMRGLFLVVGIEAIERFHWVLYGLGGLLVITGVKLFFQGDDDEVEPGKNVVLKLARRFLPVTDAFVGNRFFARIDGRRLATPLFLALLVVETTDILFAVDSVPASLGISRNLFVVYTSNIFAILGLRSLFFAVGGLLRYLHYLKHGLSVVLVFIGIKMLLPEEHEIPITWALIIVAGLLSIAIAASLVRARFVEQERGPDEPA